MPEADLLELAGLPDARDVLEVLVAEHGVVIEVQRRTLHTHKDTHIH